MIRGAMDARTPSDPIRVHKEPKTKDDALSNLRSFSVEGQQRRHMRSCIELTPEHIPRLRGCYGWLKLSGDFLNGLGRMAAPEVKLRNRYREFFSGREYFAIVYEYIEEGNADEGKVQAALDFYYMTGFQFTLSPLLANWKSGVLIDFSDIMCPFTYGAPKKSRKRLTADGLLP